MRALSCSCRSATTASKSPARRCSRPPSRSSRSASRCAPRSCWSSGSAATATRSRAAFTKLFLSELWEPFERAGQPDERWDELIEAVDSLRPLASEALLALFKLRMTSQLEDAFGKVIEQQAKRR